MGHNTLQLRYYHLHPFHIAGRQKSGWIQSEAWTLEAPHIRDDGNQDGQEVRECPDSDDHDCKEDKESLSGAIKEKEEDKVAIMMLGSPIPDHHN